VKLFAAAMGAFIFGMAWMLSPWHESPLTPQRPMQIDHFGGALLKWSYHHERYAAWCAGNLHNCRIVLAPGYRATGFTTCPKEDGTEEFCRPTKSKEYLHP
jgi:hypothetical protein